jgi:hypothetical protein
VTGSAPQAPRLRQVDPAKILRRRRLSDGTWLFQVGNGKGIGDFIVKAVLPTGKQITPKHAHFAIDMYGKLRSNRGATARLLGAVEAVFRGATASKALAGLDGAVLNRLPGYSAEYILNALEWIFRQENVNWKRDIAGKPVPRIRLTLIRHGILARGESNRGSALAIALLRQVVRRGVHPVEAMLQVRITQV